MQAEYYDIIKRNAMLLAVCVLLTAVGCKKADWFYSTLQDTPQLNLDPQYAYKSGYIVGDTLTLYGRLNPQNNLQITIGNAAAAIVSTGKTTYNSVGGASNSMDKVQLIITADMGIGSNQAVVITSGGTSINGPAIAIAAASSYTITDNLKMADYFTPPAKSLFFTCYSGNGNIYYYTSGKVMLLKEGIASEILNTANLTDDNGSFQIVTMNSGGIDPQEGNLYFSALTTDNSIDHTNDYIFRLCRYDLVAHTLTTLNRSGLPKTGSSVTADDVLPLEGNINEVHLQNIQKIVPDSKGGLYMVPFTQDQGKSNPYGVVYLNSGKALKYIFNFAGQASGPVYYQSGNRTEPAIPGISIPQNAGYQYLEINADEKILYGCYTDPATNSGGVKVFDLEARSLLNNINPFNGRSALQFTGFFTSLSINIRWNISNTIWPYPLKGHQLLLLTDGLSTNDKTPLIFDFIQGQSLSYAPGKVQNSVNGDPYQFQNEELLNTDESGQLYGTVNSGAKIVKTQPK